MKTTLGKIIDVAPPSRGRTLLESLVDEGIVRESVKIAIRPHDSPQQQLRKAGRQIADMLESDDEETQEGIFDTVRNFGQGIVDVVTGKPDDVEKAASDFYLARLNSHGDALTNQEVIKFRKSRATPLDLAKDWPVKTRLLQRSVELADQLLQKEMAILRKAPQDPRAIGTVMARVKAAAERKADAQANLSAFNSLAGKVKNWAAAWQKEDAQARAAAKDYYRPTNQLKRVGNTIRNFFVGENAGEMDKLSEQLDDAPANEIQEFFDGLRECSDENSLVEFMADKGQEMPATIGKVVLTLSKMLYDKWKQGQMPKPPAKPSQTESVRRKR